MLRLYWNILVQKHRQHMLNYSISMMLLQCDVIAYVTTIINTEAYIAYVYCI